MNDVTVSLGRRTRPVLAPYWSHCAFGHSLSQLSAPLQCSERPPCGRHTKCPALPTVGWSVCLIQSCGIRKSIVLTHWNHVPSPLYISPSSFELVYIYESQLLQNSRQKERSGYPTDPIFSVTAYRGQRHVSTVFTTLSNHANSLRPYGTFQRYLYVLCKVLWDGQSRYYYFKD